MKKLLVLTFLLYLTSTLFGQEIIKTKPFVIKGQIIDYNIFPNGNNAPNKKREQGNIVIIAHTNQQDRTQYDTIFPDNMGNFSYKTYKFVKPEPISLIINYLFFGGISVYAAPGLDLTFVACQNATNTISKITGRGSETYRYFMIRDSIEHLKKTNSAYLNLNETDYLNNINREAKFQDSIVHAIFDFSISNDHLIDSIGKIILNDQMFEKLTALVQYNKPVKEGKIAFVENNSDMEVLNNPSKDEYLLSSSFRKGVNSEYGSILNFLINYYYPNDSIPLMMSLEDRLNRVYQIFTGEVRAYILYNLLQNSFSNFNSLVGLYQYKKRLQPYMASMTETYRKAIDSKFSEKEALIYDNEVRLALKEAVNAKTFIGKPAPLFELKSNTDQMFRLSDFKGKVVILNLWTSCYELCRDENRAFNQLIQKFKDDQRIAFVSIAVYDKFDEWQKVLKEDQPEGIQLFDKDRVVLKGYIEEHVPKFILIDKEGNVVNFMAPKPSKGDDLEKLIKSELEKH